MLRITRSILLTVLVFVSLTSSAFPQALPLIFTFGVPERATASATFRVATEVDERALPLWSGNQTDLGAGVSLGGPRWTVRSMTSLTTVPIDHHDRPAFQQVDVVRPLVAAASLSVAGGGGVRQTWDGTQVLLGRLLAAMPLGVGRLQGSVVVERATSSPLKRDSADVITSVGWARPVGSRLSLGVEGIGHDLEGLWDSAEHDGGAKLLVGPSLQVRSTNGEWGASLTAGPVYTSPSTATSGDPRSAGMSGRHYAVFASASWMPLRR